MKYTCRKFGLMAMMLAVVLLLCGCQAEAINAAPSASGETAQTPPPEEYYDGMNEPEPEREPVQASREAGGGEVTVSNVDELLAAIASDTTVYLQPGTYDLSEAEGYGTLYEGGWYTWAEVHDGWELVLEEVENLTLIGTDAAEVVLSAEPRYANVVVFDHCDGITVENITVGHTEEPGVCAGGVLYLEETDNFAVRSCALYGCGILGIEAVGGRNILAENTAVYECSSGAVWTEGCTDVRLVNCEVYDCEGFSLFRFENTYGAAVVNSKVYDNNTSVMLESGYSQEVYLLGTEFTGNTVEDAMIAAENYSPVVDGCVFADNDCAIWYGSSIFSSGGSVMQAVSPEGVALGEGELEAMTLAEASYDGPAAQEEIALDKAIGENGMTVVTVSTVDELLMAIAPDTTVILSVGDYDLSEARGYGAAGGEYYYWQNNFDGPGLVITGVENLSILGAGTDFTNILSEPRYADVLTFKDCENIHLEAFTAGHTQAPSECTGGVLRFRETDSVLVRDCGLFGCGILGVMAHDCADVTVENTEIYDCTYGAAEIQNCENVTFTNCDIHDCGDDNAIRVRQSANVTRDGESLTTG